MKIVHVITDLSVGGAETMLVRLISTSRRDGLQHVVISLSSQAPLAERLVALGVEVRVLGMGRGAPSARLFSRLVQWLDELEPDVVQTWMYHADLLGGTATYAAQIMRWLRGAAVRRPALLWGVHHTDLRLTGSSRATRWIARACALMSSRVPDMIVCCAESARSSHRQGGYCPQRMTVIHNGIDLERFRADPVCRETLRRSLGIELNAPLVGIVGRYHPVKDYGTFVAAMRVVLDAMPQCRFVMAGQGLDPGNRELVALLDATQTSYACRLIGPQAEPQTLLAGLDVFCLSSKSEGLPTVIGEAMACEVPCVATDVGDTALLIGATGCVVRPEDPQALGRALIAMLNRSHAERTALGHAARSRINSLFSIEASWRRYEETYVEALGRRQRPVG
ncbi:glycosyltransferase [Caballeronia sp. SBC2]|uniref:glycosyltransferase family 4 protein n=1 Tax=Caballeronia sp. SBC2 TaxID=2705547 RepID=UPI0013E10D86|nr:glycosyltransferase [Caballeronia sp. SBC2]QIE24805.1 D-inositol-3-phosphate glycosyltransferase [Caballeronia sp. SBC2]